MTSATQRTTRRRVIFVGRPEHAPASPTAEDLHVTSTPDVFHALGEIADGSAREPVVGVLVDVDHLNLALPKVVEAFDHLDPAVRLIAVASAGNIDRAAEAVSVGFDHRLETPVAPADLQRAVLNGEATPSTRSIPPTQEATGAAPDPTPPRAPTDRPHPDAPPPSRPPTEPPTRAPSQPPAHHAAQHPLSASQQRPIPRDMSSDAEPPALPSPRAETHSAAAATPAPPPTTVHEPTAPAEVDDTGRMSEDSATPPGDIDLVRAIMDDPPSLTALALRAIREHSGRADLTFESAELPADASASAPSPQPGDVAVTGPRGDDHFGWLRAPGIAPEELSSWAQWLGTWLAMDRKMRRLRRWAYQDELTGAWNRRFYLTFVEHAIADARAARQSVTVMLFDLDDFKCYNDQYGHDAGDDILRETVKLLNSVIRKGDRVCRIGGDEFAVVFADPAGPREVGSAHPESVEQIARRFQEQVCRMKFPKLGPQAPATLSISAGIATFPWDGQTATALLQVADERALASKRRGKNAITFGPGSRDAYDRSME